MRTRLLSSVAVLVNWLAIVAPLCAANPPTFLYQIDLGAGSAPGYIALDSSNNVYITDYHNNTVLKYDPYGNRLVQWGSYGSSNGQFSVPMGIAVDRNNNVYVTDFWNDRLEKFDSKGNYLTQWGSHGSTNGQFDGPWNVTVDSANSVYVVDSFNYRVEKFDSDGNYLAQWGSFGTSPGQFTSPGGIATDSSNNVFVSDNANSDRVEVFTSGGDFVLQWGSYGSGNGQFNLAYDLAVDKGNSVYVTDYYNNRVEVFDPTGNYLTQWGGPGGTNGQFSSPGVVSVDHSGNTVYVGDDGSRIYVFVYDTNAIPPIFANQPANQTVPVNATVTLSVGVVGTAPFAYQWSSNGVALLDATNSTLTFSNFMRSATFAIVVTNSVGTAWSSNAVVTVVPALVTTLPASGITATSAVLNSWVTVASGTVAWFDWGTDTNYGNIAGATVLPGSAGTTNLSVALSLAGSVYHCRVVVANDGGIVYGNDVSFTVGFRPGVATLTPISTTNGTTLYGTVNPEGWDTTVHFSWGPGYTRTNSTPAIAVGAGATTLNISSFITGLDRAALYTCEVIAINHLGSSSGGAIGFMTPPFASVPLYSWPSVACSADGSKLIAGAYDGNRAVAYVSTNSGATWTRVANGVGNGVYTYAAVASSADGNRMVSAMNRGFYISTNAGAVWTLAPGGPYYPNLNAIASSADGNKLAGVGDYSSGVYTSTNSGARWTFQAGGVPAWTRFSCIASSADGNKLIAGSYGSLYTSTNSGAHWVQISNGPAANWYAVASSADGNRLLAGAGPSDVFISTNAGATWVPAGLSTNFYWRGVAQSADGTKMVAVGNSSQYGVGSGVIWTSTDSGATWVTNNMPSAAWSCAAMSADGNEFIAGAGLPYSWFGSLYVSQTAPAPALRLASANGSLALTWVIPSLGYTLQQSADLSSWQNMTNVPVLNLTNLENQVLVSPTNGSGFYRLKNP